MSGASQLLELRGGHDGHVPVMQGNEKKKKRREAGKRKEKKKTQKTEETKKMERDLDSWCSLVGPGFFGVFGGLVILVSLVWRFRREFCYLGAFFVAAS